MTQTALRLVDNRQPNRGKDSRAAKPSVRAQTMRAIHATWKKVVRGIDVNDKDELRSSRIAFANSVLRLNPPIESFSDKRLTSRRLGEVLDEMRRLERAPRLPGVSVGARLVPARDRARPDETAEIIHLATDAQVA